MALTCDQVLRGRVGFSTGGNPSVYVDTPNSSIVADNIQVANAQLGDILPLDPLIPVVEITADLTFPNNNYGLVFGTAPNESAIYATGADLFIEAPGNVVINNIALANLNSLTNDVANLSNDVNGLQAITGFKDSQEFYVSADGSDLTGTGSQLQPYATIQKAITEAELVCSLSSQCVIYVGAGTYTENLTITKGYLSIIGETTTAIQNGTFALTGDITFNKTDNDDLFGCFLTIQGLIIRGSLVDSSTKEHSLTLQDCRFITPNTRSYAIQVQQENVDKRVRLINCFIQENSATAFTDALVYVAGGWLYLERCDLAVRSSVPAVHLYKKSYMPRMALTSIEYESTTPVPAGQGIIWIEQDTLPHESVQSIGECTIVAPNLGVGSPKRPAIMLDIGVVPSTRILALYGCIFGITQTGPADEVISNATAINEFVVLASCFSLPGTSSKVGANLTPVPMTPVS
jgi:hypothetical protein